MIRFRPALVVALALFASSPARAQQACVASTYQGIFYTFPLITGSTTAPFFDTNPMMACPTLNAYCGWRVQADHTTGTFLTSCGGRICSQEVGSPAFATGRFTDSYTLIGPGSDPIAIAPVLSVHFVSGTIIFDYPFGPECTSGGGKAQLVRPGADSVGVQAYGCPNALDLTQDLPLSILATPGVPFDLTVALESDGACSIGEQSTASLRFDNVPQAYAIVSCKGFLRGAVPTRTTSWGRLKQIYR
ncbi:MAG: hypothetical protein ACRENS_00615 [Candidatus Eiseniibacteriota bacterium]